jgi:ribonuclease P protein component
VTSERPAAPAPGTRSSLRLEAADRVKKRFDYVEIQRSGRRIQGRCFVVLVRAAAGGRTRIGLTVTRKVGNSVHRNRIRRVVREVFRLNRRLFPEAADVVFVARPCAAALGYAEVLSEVTKLSSQMHRARALSPKGTS